MKKGKDGQAGAGQAAGSSQQAPACAQKTFLSNGAPGGTVLEISDGLHTMPQNVPGFWKVALTQEPVLPNEWHCVAEAGSGEKLFSLQRTGGFNAKEKSPLPLFQVLHCNPSSSNFHLTELWRSIKEEPPRLPEKATCGCRPPPQPHTCARPGTREQVCACA